MIIIDSVHNMSVGSEATTVTYCPSPLQIMTAVEETERGVSLSELVTGVTTRQCCRWVSPCDSPQEVTTSSAYRNTNYLCHTRVSVESRYNNRTG